MAMVQGKRKWDWGFEEGFKKRRKYKSVVSVDASPYMNCIWMAVLHERF